MITSLTAFIRHLTGTWSVLAAQAPGRLISGVQHWGRAFFMIVSDPARLNGELITVPAVKPTLMTVRHCTLSNTLTTTMTTRLM